MTDLRIGFENNATMDSIFDKWNFQRRGQTAKNPGLTGGLALLKRGSGNVTAGLVKVNGNANVQSVHYSQEAPC
jgi:hypothetical protein